MKMAIAQNILYSVLNNLRRGAISNLLISRNNNFPLLSGQILKNSIPYPIKKILYTGNVLNEKAKNFYEHHGAVIFELAAESGLIMKNRMVMRTKYCIKQELDLCGKNLTRKNIREPLYLMDKNNRLYLLKFDCKNCRMEIHLI